jgi:methionyl-tRNA formyltransferase
MKPKKIVFLTNNENTSDLIAWLVSIGEDVTVVRERITPELVDKLKPDIMISYNYRFIIKPDVIAMMPSKIINLHASFLPWNKGAYPNVWSLLEDTPKGVTIHIINEGLDTGDILIQARVFIDEENDTLATSYGKIHTVLKTLFMSSWEKLKRGEFDTIPMPSGGSSHTIKDFDERVKPLLGDKGWDITIKELKAKWKVI